MEDLNEIANEIAVNIPYRETWNHSLVIDHVALAEKIAAALIAERERWVAVVREYVRPKYLAETVIAAVLKR